MIDIIIPTIRPEDHPSLLAMLESLKKNTVNPYMIHIVREGSSYAEAVNMTYPKLVNPYFFLGADDIIFYSGWDTEALKLMDDKTMVVGTNDLHNNEVLRGEHATHYLVSRKYIKEQGGTIDGSFRVLYGYKHNYTDTEFIETAKARGVFQPCLSSVVEHRHWVFSLAPMDAVYEKGHRTAGEDQVMFNSRKHLWEKQP